MTADEVSKLRKAVNKDFAFRRIVAAPFAENNWNSYGRQQFDYGHPESVFWSDPYYQNGVVYSGDQNRALYGYLGKKVAQLSMLEDVMNQADHPEILPWKQYAASFDRSALLNCPFLRAYRLLEASCAQNQGRGYCTDEDLAPFAPQLDRAQADKSCRYLEGQSLQELAFKPVEIDLSYNPQEHWPTVE